MHKSPSSSSRQMTKIQDKICSILPESSHSIRECLGLSFFFLKNYYPPVDLGQSRVTHKSEGAGIVNCISQGYSSPLKCLPYLNPIY